MSRSAPQDAVAFGIVDDCVDKGGALQSVVGRRNTRPIATVPCFPSGLASPPKAGIEVCKSLQIAGTALDDFGTPVNLV